MCGGIASDGSDIGAEKLFQGWLLAPRSHVTKTPKMITFCWAWKILSHARLKYFRPLSKRFMLSEPWIILYRYNKFLIFELNMLESLSLCPLLNNLAGAAIFWRWCLGPSRRSQVVVESELRRLKIPADGVWPLSCSWIQVDGEKKVNFSHLSSSGLIQKAENLRHKRDSC